MRGIELVNRAGAVWGTCKPRRISSSLLDTAVAVALLGFGCVYAQSPAGVGAAASPASSSMSAADARPATLLGQLVPPAAQSSTFSVGQASTLLPDGTWLVSGGATGRATVSTQLLVFSPSTGRRVALSAHLQIARAAHTATLLADGTIFIHGGVDAHGVAIQQTELFDPVSGQSTVLDSTGLLARAHHAVTVLSDGRVLIAGGVDQRGEPILTAEIFNPLTAQVDSANVRDDVARIDAAMALLPSGAVLLTGGVDALGRPVGTSRLFDPVAQAFSSVNASAAQALAAPLITGVAAPVVATSLPAASAIDVGVAAKLMMRFNTRLNVATLNVSTVTLIGPGGATPLKAVGVDSGVLLFVTPTQQLLPASQYTLFVKGAQDNAKRVLPMFSVGFTTQAINASGRNGSVTATSTASAATPGSVASTLTHTQSALAGIDEEWIPEARHRHGEWMSHRAYLAHSSLPKQVQLRQLIQSRTPTVPDTAALVTAHAVSDQSPRASLASWYEVDAMAKAQNAAAAANATPGTGVTSLTGQVLRLNGLPLAHVLMQVGAVKTYTDANGEFLLNGIPSGAQMITMDGAPADRPDATYGRFQYLYSIAPGKNNLLPFTVWMPKLDTKHAVHIDSPTRADTVISNPTMPGLSITLPKGTVVRDVDGKIVTEVTLTPIPVDQPPYPMPYVGVPLHYSIQPGGAVIQSVDGKPKGAVVRYPNYTSFGPGTDMQLFDYDAKGRGWYTYGKAKVASNGTDIVSDRDFLIYQFGTTSYSSGGAQLAAPNNTCHAPPLGLRDSGNSSWGAKSTDAGSPSKACPGDPVDLQYGQFTNIERDLYVADVIPIDVTRSYRASGSYGVNTYVPLQRSFGADTSSPYEAYLVLDPSGTRVEMTMGDGSVINFDNPAGATAGSSIPGSAPYDSLVYQNTIDQGGYRGAYIYRSYPDPFFILTFRDGRHWAFSAYSARLVWVEDRVGNRLTLARPNVNAYVTRVTSPNGRFVDFTYNNGGQIATETDNLGRQFSYTYATDPNANVTLQTVVDPNGKSRQYGWGTYAQMTQITDPNGVIAVKNNLESVTLPVGVCAPGTGVLTGGSGSGQVGITTFTFASGRVLNQTLADGSQFSYTYGTSAADLACQVNAAATAPVTNQITDRRGVVRAVTLDVHGNVTNNVAAQGKPEQQTTTYTYDATTNLLSSTTDALNRQTTYQYDTNGNLLTVTRLAGTANAVSTSATYDPVFFNQPLTSTNGNNFTTTLGYDSLGNLTSVKDALGHTTMLAYDPQGRVNSVTNALGKTTTLTYSGADLSTISDPLNRQTQFITDAVGRVMTQIDGLGNRTYQTWDPLNRLTQITDALGGLTKFGYDNNGNVLTQTDANSHTTTFTYNGIGQVASKKDALLNLETSLYEPGGLLKQRTDRKGQVSGVTYDNLGRVATIGFGATAANPTAYTSTATLTWDAGNRLTKVVDVQAGKTTTITRTFDGLNRMTSEVTEQGEVDYAYDNGGRRTGMTIKNGPSTAQVVTQSLAYTYDNADRLTKILQASAPVNNSTAQPITFAYDNANRMILQTESTGLSIGYTYTDADEIQSITYKTPTGTVIQSGAYTYDAAGHHTSVTGDLATFVQASGTNVTDAAYNANNQLTTWSGKTFAYDKNGSMTSDGTNTYTWDARGQLTGVTGGITATFQYDTQRRRLAKTFGGATTAYLYDGDNFVQELSGLGNMTTVNANLISGGTDQLFLRSTGTGSTATLHWVLPDANNNVIALTDSTGTVQKSYAYDPYGNTTPGTGADANSQQYTGRENDGSGLYFYRNRYYMPGCNRFISEDPIGWASGQTNNYAYVGANPMGYRDPQGTGSVAGFALLAISTYGAYRSGCATGHDFANAQAAAARAQQQQNQRADQGEGQPVNEQQIPASTIANLVPALGPIILNSVTSLVLAGVGGGVGTGSFSGAFGGAALALGASVAGFVDGFNGESCGVGLSLGMHPFTQTYSIF